MAESTSGARNTRMVILFAVLALMLFALWYDHKVARPSVERAWADVSALNDEINANSGNKITTSADIQKKLNRQPAKVLKNHPPYVIEVYSWMAGLPFRTHNYYAIYTSAAGELRFVTHYMYELPPGELERREAKPPATVATSPPGDLAEQMEKYAPKKARSKRPSKADRGEKETEDSAGESTSPEGGQPATTDAPREESPAAAKPELPQASEEKGASEPPPAASEETAAVTPAADSPPPSPPEKSGAAEPTAAEPEPTKPSP